MLAECPAARYPAGMASLAYRRWLGGFAITSALVVPALSATAPGCDDPPFPDETEDKDGVNPVPSPAMDDSVGPGLGASNEGAGGAGGGDGGAGGGPPPLPCRIPMDCEDDNPCTLTDCVDNLCEITPAEEDNNACTDDTCNEATGEIMNLPIDEAVDDNDACTYTCDPATGVVNGLKLPFFSTGFEDSTGWTIGPQWYIGSAAPSQGGLAGGNDPPMDFSSDGMDEIAGTGLAELVTTVAAPGTFLTSPAINVPTNLPAGEFVTLQFMRWLNSDAPPEMISTVEVLTCPGSTYQTLWTNTGLVLDSTVNNTVQQGTGWFEIRLDMTAAAQACKTAGMPTRVRFGFSKGTATPSIGGWNIDDLTVSRTAAPADNDICTLDGCSSVGAPPGVPTPMYVDIMIDDSDDATTFACDPGTGPSQNPN